MIAQGHAVFYSFREYLSHEAASNTKHEYLDGRIFPSAAFEPVCWWRTIDAKSSCGPASSAAPGTERWLRPAQSSSSRPSAPR